MVDDKGKDKAAQSMANRRWANTSLEDRKKHGKRLNLARKKKLSAKQRTAIARKAGLARGAQIRAEKIEREKKR